MYGDEERTLERIRRADRELDRLGRRGALVNGLVGPLDPRGRADGVGVLAVSVQAHETGALDGVLVAMLALLAFASFESVAELPSAARELSEALASGTRVLDLIDRGPAIRDPEAPLAPPAVPSVELKGVTARYGRESPRRSRISTSGSTRAAALRLSDPAARARRPSRTSFSASSIRRRAG